MDLEVLTCVGIDVPWFYDNYLEERYSNIGFLCSFGVSTVGNKTHTPERFVTEN